VGRPSSTMTSESTHEAVGSGVKGGRPTVLVADDDRGLADTYAIWFESRWNVRVVYSGREALDELSDDLDVVVLDRRMPEVPGDQVLEEIRAADIDCRVVMITALKPDLDAVELPFDEYLTKPVTKQELVETIEDLLLRSEFGPEVREYAAETSKAETIEEADIETDEAGLSEVRERLTEGLPEGEEFRQFERLTRVNTLVREIDQQVLSASTVDEVASTVCAALASAESYDSAWFGEYTPRVSRIQPRAAEGLETDLETKTVDEEAETPLARAVGEREAVATSDADVATDVAVTDEGAWVPVVYRETMYGVLCVGASDDAAFADPELEVLEGLGATVGAAINAVEREKMMVSDQAIELEFETTDTSDLFVHLSTEHDCRLVLDGLVPAADGALLCYTTVENATAEDVHAFGEGTDAADGIRGLGDAPTTEVFEWNLPGDTVISALTEAGATVQTAVFEHGSGTITAQVARDAEVRPVVDRVLDAFPQTDLLAQRSVEQSIQSANRFRQALEERLTDQQQAALEAAYAAGYFEWPRDSTAEDIAESMGIDSSTFHQHLRAALGKLLDIYFAETDNERVGQSW